MPRHHTPLAKAKATGAAAQQPKRFAGRNDPPDSRPLGEPSPNIKSRLERELWEAFKRESGYLTECDRTFVEMACPLRAKLYSKKGLDFKERDQLMRILTRLGMSPVDRARVVAFKPDDKKDDAESYLQ